MGISQSTPQQQQQYYQPPKKNNSFKTKQITNSVKSNKKDSEMMKNIKSKNLFYYIVALKDKENKTIEGYDLMIAVNNNHEIQNTQVLSIDDYNKIAGSDDFKNKFNKKIKTVGRRGGTINNIQQCPPCALQQPQQQIQYQKDTTFGQSFISSFGAGLGAGLGVMSTVLLMDLLLPRFNYYGYGYYDTYGYDNDVFIEVNNYYPDNYDEGYEDATDNQENSGVNLDSANIDNDAYDDGEYYENVGDFSGGGKRSKKSKKPRKKSILKIKF